MLCETEVNGEDTYRFCGTPTTPREPPAAPFLWHLLLHDAFYGGLKGVRHTTKHTETNRKTQMQNEHRKYNTAKTSMQDAWQLAGVCPSDFQIFNKYIQYMYYRIHQKAIFLVSECALRYVGENSAHFWMSVKLWLFISLSLCSNLGNKGLC